MAYTTPNTSSLQSLLFDTELPMGNPEAARYKARTTVERTNSELKDGYLPDKIYRRAGNPADHPEESPQCPAGQRRSKGRQICLRELGKR